MSEHNTEKLDALANDYATRRKLSEWDRALLRSFVSWLPIAEVGGVSETQERGQK